MTADPPSASLRETLACFDGPEPLTTTEVAEAVDVGRRSTYERLERLVADDHIATKKVGASARVWWRPLSGGDHGPSPNEPIPDESSGAVDGESPLLDALFERVPVNLYLKDAEGRHVRTSTPYLREEYPDESWFRGKTDHEIYPGSVAAESHADDMRVIESGEPIVEKVEYNPEDDEWLSTSKVPWREDGEVRGLVGVTRVITEREERERELEARVRQQEVLTDLGQRALADRDLDGLLSSAAERVVETLDHEHCAVFELADDGERLRCRASAAAESDADADRSSDDLAVSATDSTSPVAAALERSDPVAVADLASDDRYDAPAALATADVRRTLAVALGPPTDPWGVLVVRDSEPGEYAERDVDFARSVAAVLATAIERHDRERVLRHQREQLAAMNSLHAVVRDITDAVVDQSTREEIEATVCERLAATDSYDFAWIGEVDVPSQTVSLRTEAGVKGYLDDVTISVDPDDDRSEGPTGRAIRTREVQTSGDARTDERHAPWREHVAEHGFVSSAAVPIVHEDSVYGVLNVYADRPHAFEERERDVVAQIGEVVGHAIAATERKRALLSDEVVELEFHVPDAFAVGDATDGPSGAVTLGRVIPLDEGEHLVYGSGDSDAVGGVRAAIDQRDHWDELSVWERDDGRVTFEVRVTDSPVLSTLASLGGSVEEAVVEDGDYRLSLQVAPGADVRRVVDAVGEAYPAAVLQRRSQHTREVAASRTDHDALAGVTDRQRAALEAARHAGFFEWPRDATGGDVAAALGVAAPTFHQHVRKAEKTVFDALLGTDGGA